MSNEDQTHISDRWQSVPIPRTPEDDARPRVRKEIDLFEHGRHRALESGVVDAQEADLRTLEHFAEAVGRESFEERYDPDQGESDGLRQAEHNKVLKDRAKLEEACQYTTAEHREAERTLGNLPAAGEQPRPKPALVVVATVASGATLAPTCYERFFSGGDPGLGLIAAVALGLTLGAVVVLFILFGHGARGERPTFSWLGATAGMLIAVAFGGLRIQGAEDFSDILLGVFLTLIEVGIVGFLEMKAASLRAELREWSGHRTAEDQAKRARDAVKLEDQRLRGCLAEVALKIRAHLRYVESRNPRFRTVEDAIAAAVKSAHDGYFAGLAENRGYLIGTGRRPQ